MEVGLVEKIDIDSEMQQAYLDYAMSVIVARALPDARDGLKPVHRRILYAMYDMGLRPDSPFKKSARIVGEVLGKYHPHGDMAVYEAMARMAQDFSMRYMLVDGQGNFGSVDGDSPAAMRYTEARLAAPALNLLADITKNTVNFSPNFDGSLNEPDVLPAAIPNLLVNGATGIAVGMSTSVPPHNLAEVVDALKYMLENWNKLDDINVDDLMQFIQGPDFPTGGVIIQDAEGDGLHSAYGSGRGRVTVQARARWEEMERGRSRIIVTELPFMTNKSALIERIAELAREERLEGISDLRDESDRQGMRIVIELSKSVSPETFLQNLYKHTPMQSTFSIIMLALVDGEPRLLSLKQALRVYLDHRLEIVRRRSEYDLERARHRAHILEGLRVALKNLDEVIDLIRKAPDADTARTRLMKRFKLTEVQAQAILDLQLRRLASLERKKIEEEYKEVQALIKELESLLRSPVKMRQVVSGELQAVKEAYGDRRRTQIVQLKQGESRVSFLTAGDLASNKMVWVAVTPQGLISRTLDDQLPHLSGDEAPEWLARANTRDILYLVSETGEAAATPVHSLPEKANPLEGIPFYKACALTSEARLSGIFSLPPKAERADGWYLLTATRQGMLKKSALGELPGPSANTFTLTRVNEGDRLGWIRMTDGQAEVLLVTASGMAIRFSEEEVRPMGLVAAGVMGLKLQAEDEVVGMEIVLPSGERQPAEIFLLSSDGSAKRLPVKEFPKQGRYGQGVSAWKLPNKIRVIGLAAGKGKKPVTLHLENQPAKEIQWDAAPLQNRAARGKALAEVKGSQVRRLSAAWATPRPVPGVSLEEAVEEQGSGGAGELGSGWRSGAGEQGGKGAAGAQEKGSVGKGVRAARTGDGKGAGKAATVRKSTAGGSDSVKGKATASRAKAEKAGLTGSKDAGQAISAPGRAVKGRVSKTAPKSAPAKTGPTGDGMAGRVTKSERIPIDKKTSVLGRAQASSGSTVSGAKPTSKTAGGTAKKTASESKEQSIAKNKPAGRKTAAKQQTLPLPPDGAKRGAIKGQPESKVEKTAAVKKTTGKSSPVNPPVVKMPAAVKKTAAVKPTVAGKKLPAEKKTAAVKPTATKEETAARVKPTVDKKTTPKKKPAPEKDAAVEPAKGAAKPAVKKTTGSQTGTR